jgi:hypothetical protein
MSAVGLVCPLQIAVGLSMVSIAWSPFQIAVGLSIAERCWSLSCPLQIAVAAASVAGGARVGTMDLAAAACKQAGEHLQVCWIRTPHAVTEHIMFVCVCLCVCVCACVYLCACVCVCACVCTRVRHRPSNVQVILFQFVSSAAVSMLRCHAHWWRACCFLSMTMDRETLPLLLLLLLQRYAAQDWLQF